MTSELRKMILDNYNRYTKKEFNESPIYYLPDTLSLAYSEYIHDNHYYGLQVIYDLNNEKYQYYIFDELIKEEPTTLRQFATDLMFCDFDSFISFAHAIAEEHLGFELY